MKTKFLSIAAALMFFVGGIVKCQSVKIGSQEWSSENLNVTTFRNGDPIPEAESKKEWKHAGNNGKPIWCYYNFDAANGEKYGKLYNWYAVNDSRGLAPQGWHIPTDDEWNTLINYLGGYKEAGTKMKSSTGWAGEGNGDNSSGFSTLPAGIRISEKFYFIGQSGYFWSDSGSSDNIYSAGCRYLTFVSSNVDRNYFFKGEGLSVRCVRDLSIDSNPTQNIIQAPQPQSVVSNSQNCSCVDKNTDIFNGQITFRTPILEPISFEKVIKDKDTILFAYLKVCSLTYTTEPGVIILFEDGTKIEKPEHKVDGDVADETECGYEMSAFIHLSAEDIEMLKTKSIKAFRLFIHDNTDINGNKYEEYFNCLLKAK